MDRAQGVDEKMGTFVVGFMVIKRSKMAHFFVFSADDGKNVIIVGTKHFSASKRPHLVLLENAMVCWVLSYISYIAGPSFWI